jgi:hypothetical protein
MDRDFLISRIVKIKEQIVANEAAILALSDGVKTYVIDTGQTKQTVTKFDLDNLIKLNDALDNMLATYEARLNGATIHGVPAW